MSKALSAHQLKFAGEILGKHGDSTDTLRTGTDIKRIVKNDVRIETFKDDGVVFFADAISIDGTMYKYRQGEASPTGTSWRHFYIRVAGHDTPLQTVLKLRGISIGELLPRDEAARKFASTEHTARRKLLERSPKNRSRLVATKAATHTVDQLAGCSQVLSDPRHVLMLEKLTAAAIDSKPAYTVETQPGMAYLNNADGTLTPITVPNTPVPILEPA
jgi:hypothetical protein